MALFVSSVWPAWSLYWERHPEKRPPGLRSVDIIREIIYFDNVAGLDRTRWLPNLANPFYFNELWARVTGFDRR